MPRGRQYYDPIVQAPGTVEGEPDLSRIELYPEGDPNDPNPRWVGRRINPDGSVRDFSPGGFDHDVALAEAEALWPGLTVYELRSEGEDSTWEGHGPSPRLWQKPSEENRVVPPHMIEHAVATEQEIPPTVEAAPQPTEEQVPLRLIPIEQPGAYVLLDDICRLLEMWAVSYEMDKNPSGALALREAVDTLKEIG